MKKQIKNIQYLSCVCGPCEKDRNRKNCLNCQVREEFKKEHCEDCYFEGRCLGYEK